MNSRLNPLIEKNSEYVKYFETIYSEKISLDDKINFISYIMKYMSLNTTKYFNNPFFENELNKISSTIITESITNNKYKKSSILHIGSEFYSTGGHTKLLELMISNLSKEFAIQDVAIIEPFSEVPESLKSILNKIGTLYILESENMKNRAIKLAELASQYEYIFLHIHPYEIIANLAFGNSNFKRPVYFVNHADQMFGCGVSISDVFLELSNEGKLFSLRSRQCAEAHVINIPIEKKNYKLTKEEARKKLNISEDKKIVLSIGSEYKFGSDISEIKKFTNMCNNIISDVENCQFLIVGPSKNNKIWNDIFIESDKKIDPLGVISRDKLEYYISAADLYIESFPFGSYTVFLDVLAHGCTSFSLKTPIFSLDCVKKSNLKFDDIKSLENAAVKYLKNSNDDIYDIDISMHYEKKWNNNLIQILHNTTHIHCVKKLDFVDNVDIKYLNFIHKVMGNDILLGKVFSILPKRIKFLLILKMKNLNLLSKKNLLRAIRKFISIKGLIN